MRRIVLVMLICALFSVRVRADEGLNWSMRHSRNMISPAVNIPDNLTTNNLLWQTEVGTHQYTIPVLDGDKLYLGANDAILRNEGKRPTRGGMVLCLDKNNGEILWKYAVPRYKSSGPRNGFHFNIFNCGICSSPVINKKQIYFVASNGSVICLDKNSGELVWSYDMIKELKVYPHDVSGSTILLHNQNLYVCTSNGKDFSHENMCNTKAPSLIVLDASNGKLLALADEKISQNTFHGQWSSPGMGEVNGRQLIFFGGGDGICYAFEPIKKSTDEVQTLKCVWKRDCNPKEYRFNEDGTKAKYSGWRTRIEAGPSEIISSPVLYKDKIYVSIGQSPYHGPGQGVMHCLNAETGEPVWENRDVKRTTATVAIKDDIIYICDFSKQMLCIDATTGKTYWTHDLNSAMWCSSPVVVDEKVFIGTPRKEMWIFKASKEKQLIRKIKMDSDPIPVVAEDGRIYVATQKTLSAYEN